MTAKLTPDCEEVNREAKSLVAEGRVQHAVDLLSRKAAALGELPDEKLCLSVTLGNVANMRLRLGEFEGARQAGQTAVLLIENAFGANAVVSRYPLEVLANLAIQREEFAKAHRLLRQLEKVPEGTPADFAMFRELRGGLLLREGKLRAAEDEYRMALWERERAGQQNSPLAIPDLWNLGALYLRQQRSSEALPLFKRCLELSDIYALDSETKAHVLIQSGVAYARAGEGAPAETCFRRAIEITDALPPKLRANFGRFAYSQYATFLRMKGQKKEAKRIARTGEELFGKDTSGMRIGIESLLAQKRNPNYD